MRHYGSVSALYEQFGIGVAIQTDRETSRFFYEDGISETKPLKAQLVKDINVELEDVLFNVFKQCPRIVTSGMFAVEENLALGRRYFERDVARANGMKKLYFKGEPIADIVCRPHKEIKMIDLGEQRSRTYFAQRALLRVTSEFFPEVKFKEE